MRVAELKSDIHKLVDEIQSEQVLQFLYDFLKVRRDSQPGILWESLTKDQRTEVLLSYEESEDESNWIEGAYLGNRMKVFLTKRAEKNYDSIKQYSRQESGARVATVFDQKIMDFFDLLEDFPEIGTPEVPDRNIYGFQLTKQARIFYRVKNQKLVVLSFFDVRQNRR